MNSGTWAHHAAIAALSLLLAISVVGAITSHRTGGPGAAVIATCLWFIAAVTGLFLKWSL